MFPGRPILTSGKRYCLGYDFRYTSFNRSRGRIRPAPTRSGSEGSHLTAAEMYSTTFIMIAATLAALFTWVFCEYTVEAVRLLRVMAQEDEQRNQQAVDE